MKPRLSRTEIFETAPVKTAALSQMLPAVASQMVALAYSLADTFFVGRLNDPAQSAAVTVAAAIFLLLTALSNLFGIGGASVVSRFLGSSKANEAREASVFCLYFGLISSAVFGAAVGLFSEPLLRLAGATDASIGYARGYLFYSVALGAVPTVGTTLLANLTRAEGASGAAGLGVTLGCVVNIALDPLFVLPSFLNAGAVGAGAATAISNTISFLYFLIRLHAARKKSVLCADPRLIMRGGRHARRILRIGLPSALQYMLTVAAVAVQLRFVSKYGSEAVAAVGIAKKLDQLPLFFSIGTASGLLPLVAYNHAAGRGERAESCFRFGVSISLGFALLCVILYEAFAPMLTRLFIDEARTVGYASGFLRRMVIAMPFMSVCYPLITKFQAMGRAKESLIVSVLRKGVLDVPLYFLLDALFPLYGCMWVQPVVDTVSLSTALVLDKRLKTRAKQA